MFVVDNDSASYGIRMEKQKQIDTMRRFMHAAAAQMQMKQKKTIYNLHTYTFLTICTLFGDLSGGRGGGRDFNVQS